jgi:hypothetical protein
VNRLRVSSSLAKTGFLRESRAADSQGAVLIHALAMNDWRSLARA